MTIAPCAREPLALVNDVESLVAPLMQQKSQALRVSAPPELPSVSADAPHIQQVLVNLLVNASKFSPAGSTIDLRLHHRPSVVRTVVADRGPGLPPGNVQRLFEPYAREIGRAHV